MGLNIRKRAQGYWHYHGIINGKSYTGNTGEKAQRKAQAFAKKMEAKILQTKSVDHLFEKRRQQLTDGASMLLDDAWENYSKKPGFKLTERKKADRSRWIDFVTFMQAMHPDIIHMHEVTESHAEEYISLLDQQGRFIKRVKASGKKLAPATLNNSRKTCTMLFKVLKKDAGIGENPFVEIKCLKENKVPRRTFKPEELKLIGSKAEGWIKYIFMVGACTGLREGDICTLRWDEVDFLTNTISRKMNKTGGVVNIPMAVPGLSSYLKELHTKKGNSKFIMPSLAKRYTSEATRSGIGKQITKFLEQVCGIETTITAPDRTRKAKIKDVHSLRHTFCYLAALAGIPLPIVQSIVGHMSPEMTKEYMDHADRGTKTKMMANIPNHLIDSEMQKECPIIHILAQIAPLPLNERKELIHQINTLPPH